jgi:hypothetical protein
MMTVVSKLKIFLFFICMSMFMQNYAFAKDARLSDIVVANTRDDLLVSLNVEGAFKAKMKEAILSGLPATFSFFVNLYQIRNFWFDKKLSNIKVTHTIKYNNMKKEFTIKRSWERSEPEATQSFKEAQKLMTEIDGLKLIPLAKLEKGERYQLRAKAELSKLTLPFYLHYVLFFVSLWDFETNWYAIDFIY